MNGLDDLDWPRDHWHHVDGEDVPCERLTHCPSICDCRLSCCDAEVAQ